MWVRLMLKCAQSTVGGAETGEARGASNTSWVRICSNWHPWIEKPYAQGLAHAPWRGAGRWARFVIAVAPVPSPRRAGPAVARPSVVDSEELVY